MALATGARLGPLEALPFADEAPARAVIVDAAEPFRRPDGSSRLENTFTATLVS